MDLNYIYTTLLSLLVGYGLFLVLLRILPRRLRAENKQQRQKILAQAKAEAEKIRQESRQRAETKHQDAIEEFEAKLINRHEDLKVAEQELALQEEFLQREQARLQKLEREVEEKQRRLNATTEQASDVGSNLKASELALINGLETQSGIEAQVIKDSICQDQIQACQLENQKVLRFLEDDLSTNAKRLATRVLSRVQSRYAPEFPWPKAINHVEISDRKVLDLLNQENSPLNDLRELTEGVNIELLNDGEESSTPSVKLVGGFGVYKEAARLALEELVSGRAAWKNLTDVYQKHCRELDRQALLLGQKAITELGLEGIHPEIMRMVGNLNWRTSYRQNQYLHTFEVAQLAGIMATELGVDPDEAKRCGLLHDIGKTIDYRIEGSHAVISGDYADRYGESRVICDTVMSHHNDLVLETPLSYVLKAADTLSGARPGARVNLEEGYQIRLSAIDEAVRSFPGVSKVAIMNGGREVHVEFNHKRVQEHELKDLSTSIARKIEEDVAYPGQIKILVTRKFEAVAVA